jgi:hypothetical protein
MKRIILVALAGIALAACEPTPEQKLKLERSLPPGCAIHDVGEYGPVRHLVIVECQGRRSLTLHHNENRGKSGSPAFVTVQID